MIFTVKFWKDAAERTLATFAAAVLGASWVGLDKWTTWAGIGTTTLATLLKCVAATKTGDPDSASLLPMEGQP